MPVNQEANQPIPMTVSVHVHILRHPCGYALANKGMVTRRLQHYLGHASITKRVFYQIRGTMTPFV
jgi:site-specific recombinase XerD